MNPSIPSIETCPTTGLLLGGGRIEVMACDPGWLVVDKPCGMSIHNDPGADLCSVIRASVQAGRLPGMGQDRPAIHAVHRIDRGTSGIVLLAGDAKMLAWFGGQFATREVQKRYLALVHGCCCRSTVTSDWTAWDWPLTAGTAGRNHPMGNGIRVPCTTRWRPLAHSRHYTLIECEPMTGRKHQIRRHAKLAGHPVVGDRRYGSARSLNVLRRHHDFHRLGLHAHALTVRLPGETRTTTFLSGGLPDKMRKLLEADR
ncbi:MAG: RNA pseudouridine synthase [Desulfosarcina sp.]